MILSDSMAPLVRMVREIMLWWATPFFPLLTLTDIFVVAADLQKNG